MEAGREVDGGGETCAVTLKATPLGARLAVVMARMASSAMTKAQPHEGLIVSQDQKKVTAVEAEIESASYGWKRPNALRKAENHEYTYNCNLVTFKLNKMALEIGLSLVVALVLGLCLLCSTVFRHFVCSHCVDRPRIIKELKLPLL